MNRAITLGFGYILAATGALQIALYTNNHKAISLGIGIFACLAAISQFISAEFESKRTKN